MLPRPGQLNGPPTAGQIMAGWPGGVMPAGWYGGPITPQGMTPERQYAGHAQYDPELYAEWRQQHPNDPRQYAGPGGLPQDYQNKVYDQRGRQLWQQRVNEQQLLPGKGGSQPLPQGGLAVTTPGIPAADDPYWRQLGQQAIGHAGAPYLPGGNQAPPNAAPDFNQLNAQLRGKPAGTTAVINGRTYRINANGAIIDISGGEGARVRVTNRQGIGQPQQIGSGLGGTSAPTPGPGAGTTSTTQSLQQARQLLPGGTASTQSLSGQTGTGGAPSMLARPDLAGVPSFSASTGMDPGHSFSLDTSGTFPTYHWNNARAEPVPWVDTYGRQNYNPGGAGYFNTKGPNFLGYDSNGVEIGNRGYMGAAPFNRPDLFSGGR